MSLSHLPEETYTDGCKCPLQHSLGHDDKSTALGELHLCYSTPVLSEGHKAAVLEGMLDAAPLHPLATAQRQLASLT